MKLVCTGYTKCVDKANKLAWDQIGNADFTILHDNDEVIVDAQLGGRKGNAYSITLAGNSRVVTAKEIVPSVRLYLDVQRRRKTLAGAAVMFVRVA